ncbi:suppressor of fused domain protein [Streptomyces sp. NPDC059818]|uniref:suppressor of fused domain protein n=1 Tax=Streptomyces sp. NPDC059818 TaxID=3346962 RepID=UPI00364A970B
MVTATGGAAAGAGAGSSSSIREAAMSGAGIGGTLTHLYAAMPVYFDDGFFSVDLENGTHVSLVWLVPIHGVEANYVTKNGWPAFEEELTKQDPDLFDLDRPPMSL